MVLHLIWIIFIEFKFILMTLWAINFADFNKKTKLNFQKIYLRSLLVMKWSASFRSSFRPNSAWGSIGTKTTRKTHPTLHSCISDRNVRCHTYGNKWNNSFAFPIGHRRRHKIYCWSKMAKTMEKRSSLDISFDSFRTRYWNYCHFQN